MSVGAPAADALARDYLLIGLDVGRLQDGIVDAYFGPADIASEAAARATDADELDAQAVRLRERVAAEEPDAQRARWLDRQLVARETG